MAIGTSAAIALAIGMGASTAGGVYAAKKQSGAAERNARDARRLGETQAAAEERISTQQMEFLKEKDAREYQDYLQEQTYNRAQDTYNKAQHLPFHNFSVGALAQMGKPIAYTKPAPGTNPATLGALMFRKPGTGIAPPDMELR